MTPIKIICGEWFASYYHITLIRGDYSLTIARGLSEQEAYRKAAVQLRLLAKRCDQEVNDCDPTAT